MVALTAPHRRLLVPATSTLVMLLVLIGLGTWQVYRLQWKQALLERIAIAEAAPPVPLTTDPDPYTKVFVTGRFRFDRGARFGADVRNTRIGPAMGFFQLVPLQRDGAPTILVDRGWIPQQRDTVVDNPSGDVTVVGYIRSAESRHWFSATDDVASRHFYTLDPEAIGAALGVPNLAPFTLVAIGPPTAYPDPEQNLPRPPNNHLSYVITWYGLALTLVIVFVVWVREAPLS